LPYCTGCGTEAASGASFCSRCGRELTAAEKSAPTTGSAVPERSRSGCSPRLWMWALIVLACVGLFSGFYSFESDSFSDYIQTGPDTTIRFECRGRDQVGGPGTDQGVFDEQCAQGVNDRQSRRPAYLAVGGFAAAGAAWLAIRGRRERT
jgi:hypothetical protein